MCPPSLDLDIFGLRSVTSREVYPVPSDVVVGCICVVYQGSNQGRPFVSDCHHAIED